MKFVLDERVKHRLTGLVVILSIAAIFVPAMVKKSNHHFEDGFNVSIRLPAKPQSPKVVMIDKKNLFKSIKPLPVTVAKMPTAPHPISAVKAQPISPVSILPAAPHLETRPVLAQTNQPKAPSVVAKPAVSPKKASQAASIKKEIYVVQLASFVQESNAQLLVTRLRSQGYVASYNKFSGKQGEYYKVVVGHLSEKNDALLLNTKLSTSLQLHGFVVKTEVS